MTRLPGFSFIRLMALVIPALFCLSCDSQGGADQVCEPGFFTRVNAGPEAPSEKFLELSPALSTPNGCGYNMRIRHWLGIVHGDTFLPVEDLAGFITCKDSVIYMRCDSAADESILFDFRMNAGDSIDVSYHFGRRNFTNNGFHLVNKNVMIQCKSKRPVADLSEVIFEFAFCGYGITDKDEMPLFDDWVFFAGMNNGVVGMKCSETVTIDSVQQEVFKGSRGYVW